MKKLKKILGVLIILNILPLFSMALNVITPSVTMTEAYVEGCGVNIILIIFIGILVFGIWLINPKLLK